MMDAFERFGLLINNRIVRTPVAIASMAGMVDAAYVLERADHIGAAFIGGYSIDQPTMDAAKAVIAEGNRKEFLYDDPVEELKKQMALMEKSTVILGLNLRGSTPESFGAIAQSLGESVVYEIDAHCRQPAMIAAGCGEHYLKKPGELMAVVRALKSENVTVSVKIRAGVAADDRLLARKLWQSGADILHIDLMDFGSAKLRQIRNSCPLMLIANNSINTFDRMREMLSHGADIVSLARKSDTRTLSGLDAAITRYAIEEGWYNSPKQSVPGRGHPRTYLLLHAGQRVPSPPDPFPDRHAKRSLHPDEAGHGKRHPTSGREPDLFWEPCLVLQNVFSLHVPRYDTQTGGTFKERVYAPETRSLRYDNEPCFP